MATSPALGPIALSSYDAGLLAFAALGLALLLNLFGISRGLAELFGPMKDEARWSMAGTPGTTWQWRMFGALFLVGSLAMVVFDQSS